MTELLLGTIILLIIGLFFKKTGKNVYLGQFKELESSREVTTLIPIPMNAATCTHDWEAVSDKLMEMPHEKKFVLVLTCHKCGLVDKTVQVTSPAPKALPPPPCEHDWMVDQTERMEMPHEQKVVIIMKCKKCGKIDKTVEATSKAPESVNECRHKWEVEKRVLIDSAYEQMLESIKVKQNYSNSKKIDPNKELNLDLDSAPAWMFKKTYICTRVCSICGNIDKTQASNFEAEEPVAEEKHE